MKRLLPSLQTLAVFIQCWAVARAVFFVKMHPINAVGITLERERAVSKMGQQHGSDANVIIDDLALGKSSFGIEHFLQVR